MDVRNQVTAGKRHASREHKARFAAVAFALSGVVGLVGVGSAAVAGASTKSSVITVSSLEKSLTTLEKGAPGGTSLTEAGSSLVYPLMLEWEGHGPAAGLSPAAGGSGAGQSGAEKGTIDIGGSDPFLPSATLQANGVLNIPLAVSAQLVNYNLPGLSLKSHLKLDGTVISEMYSGQITMWNDPAIAALNKGVKIPATKIVPVHRSDSSGDTFLFTSYLYDQDPSGVASGGPAQLLTWPNVSGSLAASGNSGVQQTCITTPGCIAYIGVSYQRSSTNNGLGYAALRNGYKKAKHYILANANSINNEVASYKNIPSDGGISLIDSASAPEGYPIVNFEYAIVKQSNPKAAAVKAFLAWAMDPRPSAGSATNYLVPVNFRALPANALNVAIKLIQSIS